MVGRNGQVAWGFTNINADVLDLVLLDLDPEDPNRYRTPRAGSNVGGDPVEVFGFTNAGPATTFGIIILRFSGPNLNLMKFVSAGISAVTINEFDTKTGASWGRAQRRSCWRRRTSACRSARRTPSRHRSWA